MSTISVDMSQPLHKYFWTLLNGYSVVLAWFHAQSGDYLAGYIMLYMQVVVENWEALINGHNFEYMRNSCGVVCTTIFMVYYATHDTVAILDIKCSK